MNEILKEYDLKTRLLFIAFYTVARLLHATYRYRVFGFENRLEASRKHNFGSTAIATWHGNSFAGTIAHTYQKFSPLCSRSKDGSMVAYLCSKMGCRPARGSSSRGGKAAREELLEYMKDGWSTAITVDGPKGPPHETKSGIISIAKSAGCAVLPMAGIGEKNWQLRSWDKLKIPKPFSRVAIVYGKQFQVPSDTEGDAFTAFQSELTKSLMEIEETHSAKFAVWNTGMKISNVKKELKL
jgi:lysophospholipid acyltransferase (LPLAT)-like uncharacterized protein